MSDMLNIIIKEQHVYVKDNDVCFILFDKASSYWMIALNFDILDETWKSFKDAQDYLLACGYAECF